MAAIVDSIAERWLNQAVINQECGDLRAASVKDDAFRDVVAHHFDALRSDFLDHVAARVNVERECLLRK